MNLLDFDSETFLKSRWSSACPLPPTLVLQTTFHFFLDSRRNHLETDLEPPELTTLPLEAASRVACQVRSRKGEAEADWQSIQQLQRAACNRPSPKPNCTLIQSHLRPLIPLREYCFLCKPLVKNEDNRSRMQTVPKSQVGWRP